MNRIYIKILIGITIFPMLVFGDGSNTGSGNIITCKGIDCEFGHVVSTFNNVVNFMIKIAMAFMVLGIVYIGYLYLTSGGDSGKLGKVKTIFKNFMIGLFFTIFAYGLVKLFLTTLGFDTSGFNFNFK